MLPDNVAQGIMITQNFMEVTEKSLTQMESSADTYEQTLNLENNNYDIMEALADVYELISNLESKINDIETQLKGGK